MSSLRENDQISVSANVVKEIKAMLQTDTTNAEFEIRLNYILNGKMKSGISNSTTKKAREMWYDIAKRLKADEKYVSLPVEKTLSESYGNFRRITNLGSVEPPLVQEKKRIGLVQVMNIFIENVNYAIRFFKSTEKTFEKKLDGEPDNVRMKTRMSFKSQDKTHQFDLTYTTDKDGNYPSYEVEIEYFDPVKIADDMKLLFVPVKLLLSILKNNTGIVEVDEYNGAIKAFNKFFENDGKFDMTKIYKRALPQPINLKKRFIEDMDGYAVTNKLNGIRMIGVILNGNLYGIDMVSNVVKIGTKIPEILNGTVFDAEYFQKELHIFDILFRSNKDMREYNFDMRYTAIQDTLNKMNVEGVYVKRFFMSPSLTANIRSAIEVVQILPIEYNDGIIFTPIHLPYFNTKIYKWKPPQMLTIDFYASKIGNDEWKLQVSGKQRRRDNITALVVFSPDKKFNDKKFNGIIKSKENITGIGEYHWSPEEMTFKFDRFRMDKTDPNFIDVANDVWEDIVDPITLENLLSFIDGQSYDPLRRYHNSIKRELIMKYAFNQNNVLDLGIGKGGDLQKYQMAKIGNLYGVEPNVQFMEELERRYDGMTPSPNFRLQIVNTKAQDTSNIMKGINSIKVDIASMFFSLSFFFENNHAFSGLIQTLSKTVIKDGYFIGTTIDGEMVRSALKGQSSLRLGNVTITKAYNDFTGNIQFGNAIYFKYEGSETVAEEQREDLVDWDMFVDKLSEHGFALQESLRFKPVVWLNSDENTLSGFYRTFVFKRISEGSIKKKEVVQENIEEPSEIKPIEPDTILKFNSPFTRTLSDCDLYRVGVLKGSLIHAVLNAIDKLNMPKLDDNGVYVMDEQGNNITEDELYSNMTHTKKLYHAGRYRKSFLLPSKPELDPKYTHMTRYGLGSVVMGIEQIAKDNLYKLQEYEIIVNLIGGYDKIDEFISNVDAEKAEDGRYVNGLVKKLFTLSKDAKHQEIFYNFVKISYNQNFKLLNEYFKKATFGMELIQFLQEYFKVNIFVMSSDGNPRESNCANVVKHLSRPSIILLHHEPNTFETIIDTSTNPPTKVFTADSPLIDKLYRLCMN